MNADRSEQANDQPGNDDDQRHGSAEQPGSLANYGEADDGQDYVDRSVIDFDPADGLLSGTAIDGTSEIPDPESVTEQADNGEQGD